MQLQKCQDHGILLLRVVTAANFLSAVGDRLGWWGVFGEPGVVWGNWANFIAYTGQINPYAPAYSIPFLAYSATTVEVMVAVMLLAGFKTRAAAIAASALTLLFAFAMAYSLGLKAPLDYSVFVDFASAFLLATVSKYRWSLDEDLGKRVHM